MKNYYLVLPKLNRKAEKIRMLTSFTKESTRPGQNVKQNVNNLIQSIPVFKKAKA